MALQHFDQKSFDAALAEGKLMMVDFWANWCMPCRMLGPVIEQLAQDYEGKAVIGKVDVDEQPELARQFGIMSIPTVMVFKNGALHAQAVGVQTQQKLEEMLQNAL